MWKAFIPRYIPNAVVLWVLHVVSRFSGLSRKVIRRNQEYNLEKLSNEKISSVDKAVYTPDTFIENQSQWNNLRFGSKYQMSYSGCEVIAAYNALLSLGEKLSPSELVGLISFFEGRGAVWKGRFGVSPKAAYQYFKKLGYQVSFSNSKDIAVINKIGEQYDTMIVTVYNDKNDITKQVHTVNVSKDSLGKFHVHNGYKVRMDAQGMRTYVSAGPYDTPDAAVKGMARGNAGVLAVIGIKNNEQLYQVKN